MQKAFDWVYRDMLFYKLIEYNIDYKIYKSIKTLYNHPLSKVKGIVHLNIIFSYMKFNEICNLDQTFCILYYHTHG